MRGAGAVRVAGDELLPLLMFVVHRVAKRARDRHQEATERDAEDEDGAREVEALAFGHLWEKPIAVVFSFVVCLVTFFTSFKRRGGGRERHVVVRTSFKRRGGGRERRVVVREGARPGVADGNNGRLRGGRRRRGTCVEIRVADASRFDNSGARKHQAA